MRKSVAFAIAYVIATLVVLSLGSLAMLWAAASTCAQTAFNSQYIEMQWVGSGSNGNVTACNSTSSIYGYVNYIETIPGTPAPTNNYDPVITSMSGLDLSGGGSINRSNSTTQVIRPTYGATTDSLPVAGKIGLAVTGNTDVGATGKVRAWYQPYR